MELDPFMVCAGHLVQLIYTDGRRLISKSNLRIVCDKMLSVDFEESFPSGKCLISLNLVSIFTLSLAEFVEPVSVFIR